MNNPGNKPNQWISSLVAKITFAIWGILIVCGAQVLISYTNARRNQPAFEDIDPASLAHFVGSSEYSLILFLHPKCSCSRATIRELKSVLSRAPQAYQLTVVMYCPEEKPESWTEGVNERLARRLGPRKWVVDSGELFSRNHILDSGHVLCFDRNQELRFSGGVTVSRPHEGPNQARLALARILDGGPQAKVHFPVFGCSIHSLEMFRGESQ